MSDQPAERTATSISRDTQIGALFALLAIPSTYATATVTDSLPLQFAVLIGVGVVVPTLLTERRR